MSEYSAKRKARMRGLWKYGFFYGLAAVQAPRTIFCFFFNCWQRSALHFHMSSGKMLFNHLKLFLSK